MMKFIFAFFLLSFFVMNISAQDFVKAGVPRELARWRAEHYSDVRYKLNITLEKGAPQMKGELEIRVTLDEEGAKNHLYLDWRVNQQAKDAKDKPFAHVVGVNNALDILTQEANEHITVPDGYLKKGENVITIQFASPIATQGSAVTRYTDREDGSEYIYTLFVPSDASTAFPCFDQPDLKAKFKLQIQSQSFPKAISNTEGTYRVINGRHWLFSFQETQPISTYVFAFAVGEFVEFSEKEVVSPIYATKRSSPSEPILINDGTGRIYVRKSQAKRMEKEAKEIFRLNRECLKYLEKYFDSKFPFPKYDLVIIPEFAYGGMEHAGATFLREERILFPTDPTANDYLSRANLMFHEAAHQWFGDLVTMKWFDDLWLKEGFAEFMSYKAIEAVMPEFNAWKAFYERNKPLAYLTDSTKGTTPIYQEIPNLNSAKSAYGNIVYRKAPSFLRQAEFFLGEDKFQKAVQNFVKKYAFKNAEWSDLVKEFETTTGKDLKAWAEVWVKQRGMPVVRVSTKVDGCVETSHLEQTSVLGDEAVWKMRLKSLVVFGGRLNSRNYPKEVLFDGKKVLLDSQNICNALEMPVAAFPNYQDYGYGLFLLDNRSREYFLRNLQKENDAFLRSMLWGSLWDSVREAELAPKDYVELVIKNISIEKDEVTIQTLLNRVSTAFGNYLSEKQAKELAPQMEKLLRERMTNAETLGQRITFYRAFLNVVSSDAAREDLKKLLSGELKINGMTMRARDKADIITRLIILNDKDVESLLNDFTKTETSDDAKRYAYAMGAARATAENKKKYFDDFTNNPNVAESWIESAFVTFNTARQSELTQPYLESALKELPKLKRTRKIFFVNGWLAAFIGGQKNEAALKIVQKFLDEEKTLDKDLRLKVLEVVDGLERTVKIRNKFAL